VAGVAQANQSFFIRPCSRANKAQVPVAVSQAYLREPENGHTAKIATADQPAPAGAISDSRFARAIDGALEIELACPRLPFALNKYGIRYHHQPIIELTSFKDSSESHFRNRLTAGLSGFESQSRVWNEFREELTTTYLAKRHSSIQGTSRNRSSNDMIPNYPG
jgi:hypothetical protein